MAQRGSWGALIVLLVFGGGVGRPAIAKAAQGAESETAMSEDERRMHEQLIELSKGEGSASALRIEFMEGGMSSHRSIDIESGHLVSKEWTSPGSPMVHLEGIVAESRVAELLRQLIAKRYWTFQGAQFVPDAPVFLFRFYYGNLQYVDFRCDLEEVRKSESRVAIRKLFLDFASETAMKTAPVK